MSAMDIHQLDAIAGKSATYVNVYGRSFRGGFSTSDSERLQPAVCRQALHLVAGLGPCQGQALDL
jgi:hypothetical protein